MPLVRSRSSTSCIRCICLARRRFAHASGGAPRALAVAARSDCRSRRGDRVFTAGFVVAAVDRDRHDCSGGSRCGAVIGRLARIGRAAIEPVEQVLVTFMHARPARLAEVIALEASVHTLLALEVATVLHALSLPFRWLDPSHRRRRRQVHQRRLLFHPGADRRSESVYTILFQALGFPAAAGLTLALVRRVRALVVAAPEPSRSP